MLKQKVIRGVKLGILSGLALVTAEISWVGFTSTHPPLLFILYLAAGDIIVLGAIGGGIGVVSHLWNKIPLSAATFGIVIGVVYGAHAINCSLVPGVESFSERIAAIFLLCIAGLVGAFIFGKAADSLSVRPTTLISVLILVLFSAFSASFLFLNKFYLPDVTDPLSLCVNAILLAATVFIFYALIRISGRKSDSVERHDRIAVPFIVALFILSVALALYNPISKNVSKPQTRAFSHASNEKRDYPSIILITLDTLRADHVSCYGYSRKTTPNIDELANHSRLFLHAVATAPTTLPSHASLFTGLFPSQHGATFVGAQKDGISSKTTNRVPHEMAAAPLRDSANTLTEVLNASGYRCGAIVANCAYLWRGFGMDQGFHYYDDDRGVYIPLKPLFDLRENGFLWQRNRHRFLPYRNATVITDKAIEWIESASKAPFFLFLNYMDPHEPYAAPPEYRNIFDDGIESIPLSKGTAFAVMKEGKSLPEGMRQFLKNEYDKEVRYLDTEVGRLLKWLQEERLFDEALIVVTSDHGESLGEHSYLGHTNCVYEQEIWVPLLIKYPHSRSSGEIVDGVVSLAEVPDIVLDEIKLPRLADEQPYVVAEHPANSDRIQLYGDRFKHSLTAIYPGELKYVIKRPGDIELYDLVSDPDESHNLASSQQLPFEMVGFLQNLQIDGQKQPESEEDPRFVGVEQRLRSLGYLH